ncbi:hypothetical protein QOU29_16530 [Pseudomonas aeruginosa]|nr:hypothetical protein [Pseudomonas aeruginosa]
MNDLKWYSFPRNSLPDVLLSMESPELFKGRMIDNPAAASDELVLGYAVDDLKKKYYAPSLLVLPKLKSAEIMAWLKIYAPETSPLSQFGRVLSHDDYILLNTPATDNHSYSKQINRWSSMVLGEILAQGDMDAAIDAVPLSRAQATFSHAVACAAIRYNSEILVETCIERLESLEQDRAFVPRTLAIRDLKSVWATSNEEWSSESAISAIVNLFKLPPEKSGDLFSSHSPFATLNDYPELLSDSAESRVLAFRKFTGLSTSLNSGSEFRSAYLAANIAVAAFLVGRSTSHVFLLKEIGRKIPAVFAWFGLIAGLVGPRYWGSDWARAARGIEKGFRVRFSWEEPSYADITWPEYVWISKTYTNNPLLELPKQLPRVLSLEIIPGATCQFRLGQSSSSQLDSKPIPEVDLQTITSLRSSLAEFIDLAEKAKANLSSQDLKKTSARRASDEKNLRPTKKNRRVE